jgi:hypothetical protein
VISYDQPTSCASCGRSGGGAASSRVDLDRIENGKKLVTPGLDNAHSALQTASPFHVAERLVPVWLVLKGSIDVVRRDGLNHEAAITSLGFEGGTAAHPTGRIPLESVLRELAAQG